MLILCCIVYLIWWYRGFRPGIYVSRAGGVNGALLLITMVLGFAGVVFSLMPAEKIREPLVSQVMIVICGIATYFILLVVTKVFFLYAIGSLGGKSFSAIIVIIAAAFLIGIVLYVAYYRMEEMRAFYAAMVPLVVDAIAMSAMIGIVACRCNISM